MDIEYQLGGPELLDRTALLWEKLREFHAASWIRAGRP